MFSAIQYIDANINNDKTTYIKYIYWPFLIYFLYVAIPIKNGIIYPLKLKTVKVKISTIVPKYGKKVLMQHIKKKGKSDAII